MAGYPYQAPIGLRFAAFYMGWETSVIVIREFLLIAGFFLIILFLLPLQGVISDDIHTQGVGFALPWAISRLPLRGALAKVELIIIISVPFSCVKIVHVFGLLEGGSYLVVVQGIMKGVVKVGLLAGNSRSFTR